MHCIILLPDAAGRMPTAQELRLRGFILSAAVEQSDLPSGIDDALPALAAEEPAPYGEMPSL